MQKSTGAVFSGHGLQETCLICKRGLHPKKCTTWIRRVVIVSTHGCVLQNISHGASRSSTHCYQKSWILRKNYYQNKPAKPMHVIERIPPGDNLVLVWLCPTYWRLQCAIMHPHISFFLPSCLVIPQHTWLPYKKNAETTGKRRVR